MNLIEHCDAFILAGGKSSRMGSDKGLLPLHNRELILSVLEPLQQLFANVAIITSNADYLKFGVPLYQDVRINSGPAGGLLTALQKSQGQWIFVTACDLPFINVQLIKDMSTMRNNHSAVVPVHGHFAEPLFAFYHRDLIPFLENAIDKNELKMQTLVTRMKPMYFNVDSNEFNVNTIFMNVNTPEDLNNATKANGSPSF